MAKGEAKLIYEFRVLDELTEIIDYLSVNASLAFADKFVDEFYEKTDKLKKYPTFYSFSSLPKLQITEKRVQKNYFTQLLYIV